MSRRQVPSLIAGVGSFLGAWFGSRITGRYGYGRALLVSMAGSCLATAWVAWSGIPRLWTIVDAVGGQ